MVRPGSSDAGNTADREVASLVSGVEQREGERSMGPPSFWRDEARSHRVGRSLRNLLKNSSVHCQLKFAALASSRALVCSL
jgi:hypothetical protein